MLRPFILLFFAAAFTSCVASEVVMRNQVQIVGNWDVERANFRHETNLSGGDLTPLYADHVVSFFPDGTTTYAAGPDSTFTGIYQIVPQRSGPWNDGGTDFLIDADYFHPDGQPAFNWLGTINRLGDKRFNLAIAELDGDVMLRMRRRVAR